MECIQKTDKKQLIEDNMNLVYFVVNKYYPTFQFDEDVIQEGMVGLCKAAEKFDESRGTAFSTYAVKSIINEIRMYFRLNQQPIEILSLDYELKGIRGNEECSAADLIVGEADIDLDLISFKQFTDSLDESERELLQLLSIYNQSEIGEKFGVSRQIISRRKKRIESKWRKFNGNN